MTYSPPDSQETQPGDAAQAPPLLITDEMLLPRQPIETRIDFERGLSYLPPLTLVLIVVNLAIYVWELASGALDSEQALVAAGALVRERVLQGEVFRVVTAMFLHAGVEHLVGNCVVLYVLGMACEHGYGTARTAVIYFASGICGSLLSMTFHPGPSVGASGAIFGLCAAVIIFFLKYQRLFFLRDKRIGFVLLFWAIYSVGTGFLSPQIDNFAHIGGFVGGAIAGAVLPRRSRPELAQAFAVIVKKT